MFFAIFLELYSSSTYNKGRLVFAILWYLHFVSVFAIKLTFNEKPIKILSTESRNSVYVFKESNT